MKIVWTHTAKQNLKEIHDFYKETAEIAVAKIIKNSILRKPKVLIKNPYIGQEEEALKGTGLNFRYLIVSHFKIIYQYDVAPQVIWIAAVFDTRKNPSKLKL